MDPNNGGYPFCPLKAVTGLDCPACGGLRCVHALMNGDIGTALDQNLIAVVVLPMIVIWAAFALAARWRGDDAVGANSSADVDAQGNAALKANALRILWVGLIVATIVFTVLRNVPEFRSCLAESVSERCELAVVGECEYPSGQLSLSSCA